MWLGSTSVVVRSGIVLEMSGSRPRKATVRLVVTAEMEITT